MLSINRINMSSPGFGELKNVPCSERALIMVRKSDMDKLSGSKQTYVYNENKAFHDKFHMGIFTAGGVNNAEQRLGAEFDLNVPLQKNLMNSYLRILNALDLPHERYVMTEKTVKAPGIFNTTTTSDKTTPPVSKS